MTIHVTQRHIQLGLRNNCERCPIALALKPFNALLEVDSESLIMDLPSVHIADLPENARRFIYFFDMGQNPQPFSFNLSAECFMA